MAQAQILHLVRERETKFRDQLTFHRNHLQLLGIPGDLDHRGAQQLAQVKLCASDLQATVLVHLHQLAAIRFRHVRSQGGAELYRVRASFLTDQPSYALGGHRGFPLPQGDQGNAERGGEAARHLVSWFPRMGEQTVDEHLATVLGFDQVRCDAQGCSLAGGREGEDGLRGHQNHFPPQYDLKRLFDFLVW